jgi:rubrerythrin
MAVWKCQECGTVMELRCKPGKCQNCGAVKDKLVKEITEPAEKKKTVKRKR